MGDAVGGLVSGIGSLFKKKPAAASRWGNTMQDLGMGDLAYYMNMFGDPVASQYFNNNDKAGHGFQNTFGQSFNQMNGAPGSQAPQNPTGYGQNYGQGKFGPDTGNSIAQAIVGSSMSPEDMFSHLPASNPMVQTRAGMQPSGGMFGGAPMMNKPMMTPPVKR